MNKLRNARLALAAALVAVLIVGLVVVLRFNGAVDRTTVVGYFHNSNGVFVGDQVRILGVPVGKILKIEPQTQRVKITFWYDAKQKLPADAKAVILSPSLVTARAIQLTPPYTGGPEMRNDAVIPLERTAVPVEFDEFRQQLQKLAEALQPTQPGGTSTLGEFVNTAADNLRGQGVNIRDTLIKLSQAFSALGDHSSDIFSTVKNLSILVSALQGSADLMRELNRAMAAVTAALADDPNEVGNAARDINDVVGDVRSFVADNREAVGTTSDKLTSVSTAITQSLDDLKQTLHITPNAFQNFLNIYQPAQGALTGVLAVNNFANPIAFLCSAIQAASRLGAEQSAKLCVQYLAPIIKNRQYNFPPLGENLFVGASARPNEITYSEDWLRPDFVPPHGGAQSAAPPPAGDAPVAPDTQAGAEPPPAADSAPLPAEARPTNPADGLPGMMVAPGAGS